MCKRKFIVQAYSVCDGVNIVFKYRIKLFCLTLSLMVSSLTFMILFTATATGADRNRDMKRKEKGSKGYTEKKYRERITNERK